MVDSTRKNNRVNPRHSHVAIRVSVALVLFLIVALIMVEWLTNELPSKKQKPQLLRFSVAVLLGGIGLAALIDALVTRPVFSLLGQVREAPQKGWITPIRVPQGRGEITELGQALEDLRIAVNERNNALEKLNEELEQRVEQRTTELQEAQDQLMESAKLAAIGQLSVGVAHEVNNPTAIMLTRLGYLLSIADEEAMDPELIEDLEVLEHQAKRISHITQSLLRFGRKSELRIEANSINDIVQLTISLLKHSAEKNDVSIELDLAPDAMARFDPGAIEQVCFNLIKNAIESDASTVWIETKPSLLIVRDNGKGMDKQTRDRIFEPFFTTKAVGEGSGLGLSISYGIVERHGGLMQVTSTTGEGTSFRVELPGIDKA